MPDDAHGTRRQYKRGCRCLTCRAANARYEAARSRDKAKGIRRLGSLISATDARRKVEQLKREQVNVAERLGLKRARVRLHTRITVRTWLKIRALWRRYLVEPDHQNP
jgi:hypothetical protein